MKKFSDIPTEKFPLNAALYHKLRNDVYAAACGFSDLRTNDAETIARELSNAQYHLECAWALILRIEDTERRREWDVAP